MAQFVEATRRVVLFFTHRRGMPRLYNDALGNPLSLSFAYLPLCPLIHPPLAFTPRTLRIKSDVSG